jgi:hypothetical protein
VGVCRRGAPTRDRPVAGQGIRARSSAGMATAMASGILLLLAFIG